MKKLAAELFGTFTLVFACTGVSYQRRPRLASSHFGIALTFGLVALAEGVPTAPMGRSLARWLVRSLSRRRITGRI
jgi:hypothetical protein